MKLENNYLEENDDGSSSPQFLLHEYIKLKDLNKLTQLLSENRSRIDINQPDWDGTGNAPILDATSQGDVGMVSITIATMSICYPCFRRKGVVLGRGRGSIPPLKSPVEPTQPVVPENGACAADSSGAGPSSVATVDLLSHASYSSPDSRAVQKYVRRLARAQIYGEAFLEVLSDIEAETDENAAFDVPPPVPPRSRSPPSGAA